ncbi:MAG: cell division protein ZapA [Desulfobacterales bacterium]|nr:cell division protein ZapA [Desulfobacteraceae bacterium]MDD3991733.1 cell division protein ZapA [Desulfobacteraceae bacterium]MDY0312733.1 cell division protein ZapA [Desulfobacterales bacterium]
MNQLLHIDLFGRTYTFKTDAVGPQAEAVAASLASEVGRITSTQSGQIAETSKLTVMMLAALNIANENYELKSDRTTVQHQLRRRTNRLIQTLDNALSGLAANRQADRGDVPGASATS